MKLTKKQIFQIIPIVCFQAVDIARSLLFLLISSQNSISSKSFSLLLSDTVLSFFFLSIIIFSLYIQSIRWYPYAISYFYLILAIISLLQLLLIERNTYTMGPEAIRLLVCYSCLSNTINKVAKKLKLVCDIFQHGLLFFWLCPNFSSIFCHDDSYLIDEKNNKYLLLCSVLFGVVFLIKVYFKKQSLKGKNSSMDQKNEEERSKKDSDQQKESKYWQSKLNLNQSSNLKISFKNKQNSNSYSECHHIQLENLNQKQFSLVESIQSPQFDQLVNQKESYQEGKMQAQESVIEVRQNSCGDEKIGDELKPQIQDSVNQLICLKNCRSKADIQQNQQLNSEKISDLKKLQDHNQLKQFNDSSDKEDEDATSLIAPLSGKNSLKEQNQKLGKGSFFQARRLATQQSIQQIEHEQYPLTEKLHSITSNQRIENSTIDQILEKISLGLLCYELQSKQVIYTNNHLKHIFGEYEESDIFSQMMKFKNYMQPENAQTLSKSHQTLTSFHSQQMSVSRNLDFIPCDLFSSEFRNFSSLNSKLHSQTDFYKSGISSISINAVEENQSRKNQISSSESSQQKKIIYSQQNTLKQQFNELVTQIFNFGFTEQLVQDTQIRFMASHKMNSGLNQVSSHHNFLRVNSLKHSLNLLTTSNHNYQAKETILQITITLMKQGNKQIMLFIIEDVTHFNQIKVLESLNKNKSVMLSQVSHEIRNPISCIIAMLEEIQQKEEGKDIMQCVQTALQSSKMLLNLLNDLLDMSQIKAGKFKLVLEKFDLLELINEVRDMMQPLAKNKEDNIQVVCSEQNNWIIVSDKYRIRQILINLISNSIKYTAKGSIFLSLNFEAFDDKMIRISVRDEGVGIKKEYRQKLFQAFGVADDMESKAKHNPNGVGLGLLISNTIAKNLTPSNNITMPQSNAFSNQKLIPSNQSHTILKSSLKNGVSSNINNQLSSGIFIGNTASNLGVNLNVAQNQAPNILSSHIVDSAMCFQDEGLLINEDLEQGSEFYFHVFNYLSTQSENPVHLPLPQNTLSHPQNQKKEMALSLLINSDVLQIPTNNKQKLKSVEMNSPDQVVICSKIRQGLSPFNMKDDKQASFKSDLNKQIIKELHESNEQEYSYDIKGDSFRIQEEEEDEKQHQIHLASNEFEKVISENVMRRKQDAFFFDTELKIMIVDDDQFSALALRSRIAASFKIYNQSLKLNFTTMYSGEECIEELKKRQTFYSFLFIDSQMPQLDGFETIQIINDLSLGLNPTPQPGFKFMQIIMCSGMPIEEMKQKRVNISHFLQKPIEQSELLVILRQSFLESQLQ